MGHRLPHSNDPDTEETDGEASIDPLPQTEAPAPAQIHLNWKHSLLPNSAAPSRPNHPPPATARNVSGHFIQPLNLTASILPPSTGNRSQPVDVDDPFITPQLPDQMDSQDESPLSYIPRTDS